MTAFDSCTGIGFLAGSRVFAFVQRPLLDKFKNGQLGVVWVVLGAFEGLGSELN